MHQRHLAAAVAANAANPVPGTNVAGEQLYSNLYGKEIGMMRKMVSGGSLDDAVPPPFTRTSLPQPGQSMINHQQQHAHNSLQQHNNLPPNMIPENMIYNPKFAQQHHHGHSPASSGSGFNFHASGSSGLSDNGHLHKMEGLLKPCYDTGNNGHFTGFNSSSSSSSNTNNNHFPPTSNHQQHHHHHLAQQQHYPNSNNNGNSSNNTNLVESPHFVNTFSSNNNNNNNNKNNLNNNNSTNSNNNGLPDVNNVLVKQESSDDFHSFSNTATSLKNVKNEPSDFNLGYGGVNVPNGKTKEELTDLHNDDSIDKLSSLNDNDRSP